MRIQKQGLEFGGVRREGKRAEVITPKHRLMITEKVQVIYVAKGHITDNKRI